MLYLLGVYAVFHVFVGIFLSYVVFFEGETPITFQEFREDPFEWTTCIIYVLVFWPYLCYLSIKGDL